MAWVRLTLPGPVPVLGAHRIAFPVFSTQICPAAPILVSFSVKLTRESWGQIKSQRTKQNKTDDFNTDTPLLNIFLVFSSISTNPGARC